MTTKPKLNRVRVTAEAKKYGTAEAFAKGASSAYLHALGHGYLNELFPGAAPGPKGAAEPVVLVSLNMLRDLMVECGDEGALKAQHPIAHDRLLRRKDKHELAFDIWGCALEVVVANGNTRARLECSVEDILADPPLDGTWQALRFDALVDAIAAHDAQREAA